MRKIISGLMLSSALMLTVSVNAADHVIKMLDNGTEGMMVFEPAFIKANKGDTITFIATDPGHNNVSRHVPEGAKSWEGDESHNVTVTVETEGVYLYECNLHKFLGMVGVLQVGEAKNLAAAQAAADKITEGIVMGTERMDNYLANVK
ncbi:Pseudoazurin [hydrothermal vent metagenome]|uniref:Pseudoazurin n=1 Tax=hydrothermal vent metagenome TaxID=652676 RepID=A0A3B1A9V2_9ZZZZ